MRLPPLTRKLHASIWLTSGNGAHLRLGIDIKLPLTSCRVFVNIWFMARRDLAASMPRWSRPMKEWANGVCRKYAVRPGFVTSVAKPSAVTGHEGQGRARQGAYEK